MNGIDRMTARITELEAERDSLRKALDDRWEADKKVAKAIFAETGRTHGFPSNTEVVAYYMAEVERLEKASSSMLDDMRELDAVCLVLGCEDSVEPASEYAISALDEVDHLRAKLERAKEAISGLLATPEIADADPRDKDEETQIAERKARAILSELSADAPVQPPQLCPVHGKPFPCCVDFDPTAPAQPPQISDDVHALLDAAIAALGRADQFISNGLEFGFIQMPDKETPDSAHETPGIVKHVLTKLRAARND